MSSDKNKSSSLKKIKGTTHILHPDSGLVFKSAKERLVIGKYVNNTIENIDQNVLELCERWNFVYDKSLVEKDKEGTDEDEDEEEEEEKEEGEEDPENETEEVSENKQDDTSKDDDEETEEVEEDEDVRDVELVDSVIETVKIDEQITIIPTFLKIASDEYIKTINNLNIGLNKTITDKETEYIRNINELQTKLFNKTSEYDDIKEQFESLRNKFEGIKNLFNV